MKLMRHLFISMMVVTTVLGWSMQSAFAQYCDLCRSAVMTCDTVCGVVNDTDAIVACNRIDSVICNIASPHQGRCKKAKTVVNEIRKSCESVLLIERKVTGEQYIDSLPGIYDELQEYDHEDNEPLK